MIPGPCLALVSDGKNCSVGGGRGAGGMAALEEEGPQRRPQRRLGRRLEEVAKAVGGGYCRLQMPLKPALGVKETVAGHRPGALEGWGGTSPPSKASLVEGGGGCWRLPGLQKMGWTMECQVARTKNFQKDCHRVIYASK